MYHQQDKDYRTLEQILSDIINEQKNLQHKINELIKKNELLNGRMMILYKEFKRFGNSVELFD